MPDKESELMVFIISGTIIFLLVALFLVSFLFLFRKRQNQNKKEKEKMKSEFAQEMLQAQLEIQEQTFKSISQEIHDNIGQLLSLAKLNLSRYEIDGQMSGESLLTTSELVSKAAADLRDLSKTLDTDAISGIGLLRSIETELQLVEKTTGIKTMFSVEGSTMTLQPQHELILFRIVQEALHNSIKHTKAEQLRVQAVFTIQNLQLIISDNGCGFDATTTVPLGSGLRNMQARSKLIGAGWQLTSNPQQGTCIILTIPLNQKHDNNSIGR